MEEFEERLEAAFEAQDVAELAPLTRDLPDVHAVAPVSMVKQPEESENGRADRRRRGLVLVGCRDPVGLRRKGGSDGPQALQLRRLHGRR